MLNGFLIGIYFMSFAGGSLFFFKFWRQSKERFFLFFSITFALLAMEKLVLVLLRSQLESALPLYLIRLIAFTVLLCAIVDHNRKIHRNPRDGKEF